MCYVIYRWVCCSSFAMHTGNRHQPTCPSHDLSRVIYVTGGIHSTTNFMMTIPGIFLDVCVWSIGKAAMQQWRINLFGKSITGEWELIRGYGKRG